MAVNFFFLIIIAFVIIRQIAYGIYCIKKGFSGGYSILVLLSGTVFCGLIIYMRGIN